MEDPLSRLPKGVKLGALSKRVVEVLCDHTAFPWPILSAQSQRIGADPACLDRESLALLVSPLARGVARFNTPEAGREVEAALRKVLE